MNDQGRAEHDASPRSLRALLFGCVAVFTLIIAALTAPHHDTRAPAPSQPVSAATPPTMPAHLRAPFDELQHAVGK